MGTSSGVFASISLNTESIGRWDNLFRPVRLVISGNSGLMDFNSCNCVFYSGLSLVVPIHELVASLVILVISVLIVFKLSARIFRTGMLMYGKKMKIKDVFGYLREWKIMSFNTGTCELHIAYLLTCCQMHCLPNAPAHITSNFKDQTMRHRLEQFHI